MREVVWVVDDCPLTLKICKVRLRSLGADVYAMPTGRSAFGAWTSSTLPKPSAILVNPDIHSGDGPAACQLLRDAGCGSLLLLLVDPIAAHIDPEPQRSLIDGTLIKPVSTETLARVLEKAVARHVTPAA